MGKISLDIDGVLTDYPRCWIDFLNQSLGTNFVSKEEARTSLGDVEYSRVKNAYRTSEYKATLPVNDGSESFVNALRDAQHTVIIATSRPIDDTRYPKLRDMTESWLRTRDVPFTHLIKKNMDIHLIEQLSDINLHLDDEPEYVDYLLQHGIPAALYDPRSQHKREERFVSFDDVLEYLRS